MAFVIRVETGRGKLVRQVVDSHGLLPQLLPSPTASLLLADVDPYGDTLFNGLQAKKLLVEWDALEEASESPAERDLCKAIRELLVEVRDGVHLFLRFVGD